MSNIQYNLSLEQVADTERQAREIYLAQFGNPPKESDYIQSGVSEYPDWLRYSLFFLMAVVMVFAFIPSSIRIYTVGSETFSEGVEGNWAKVAGISLVMLAEFSAVLFTLSATILTDDNNRRRMFYWLTGFSVLLAISGNAAVAFAEVDISLGIFFTFRFWFQVLEAFLPSLFVFGISAGIERIALTDIKARRIGKMEFEKAREEYKRNISGFESSDDYINLWATAIKNKVIEINILPTQKRSIRNLEDYQWAGIVHNVMQSKNWFSSLKMVETANSSDSVPLIVTQSFTPFQGVSRITRFSSAVSEVQSLQGKKKVQRFLELEPNHGLTKSEIAELLEVSNATVTNATQEIENVQSV